ncbi:hypothetical protein [Halorarum halophilum]|uniref:hypothetical protein n=1 Tax=Halorarum halophilum TaxID=2743090 RepID=UPI001C4E418F|nr:hypothetical protein [Halobaculum halophilum]
MMRNARVSDSASTAVETRVKLMSTYPNARAPHITHRTRRVSSRVITIAPKYRPSLVRDLPAIADDARDGLCRLDEWFRRRPYVRAAEVRALRPDEGDGRVVVAPATQLISSSGSGLERVG